ncbi:ABC transporter substrate-binding protein [Fundicoccus culcitae]|uniref:ABC transporter substrate-binding protein n=1 Tax=Fundicoccus culcitae TaxID=2969821 RepID=A0ABY5P6S8_9LACT|nr:ABC transporter substrate-binding protein [Fundicoccus culcitae]UUX34442.1 ABC transporter substrate-binding protein [Fundicoccus culcitae]
MKKLLKFALVSILLLTTLFINVTKIVNAQEDTLTVGIVQLVSHPSLDQIVSGIYEGLEEQGYIEGENLTVDFNNAQGDINLLSQIAEGIVHNEPDLIFAVTTPVAQAFQHLTTDIPIIMVGVTDPLSAGLVENLDQPEANITGVSDMAPIEEQFDLLIDLFPEVTSVGMIYTTSEDNSLADVEAAKAIAEERGLEFTAEGISASLDMQLVAENLASKAEVIYVGSDNTVASAFGTLLNVTDKYQIPVFTSVYEMIEQGAFAGVTIEQKQVGVLAAEQAVLIANGQAISETPIAYVTELNSVYRSDVLEQLGLEIDREKLEALTDISGE